MIGETIGNFRVVKRLGSGGMGEVYLAEHKDLQTPVAVKLLNKDISNNKDHVQRFFNEARVVSKIKSAGTVKIFDSGFHNDQAYLIMELLEGDSLASRLAAHDRLPVPDVLHIAKEIASVLEATHRQGVIHRDLKPDNIFLVHDDERATGERVKILDFGIAKLTGTLAMASPKTSGTMGTPAYMAPEQWGDSSNVDWRVDVYSLGCVMFELACGQPPFQANNIAEAFVKHATAVPPTPSSFVPEISPELDQLILRLLAKEPADRCTSMGQIVRELAELAGETLPEHRRHTPAPMPRVTPPPTGPDAVITAPAIPSAAVTATPRRASSQPAVGPPMSATTLGGSAAQLTQVGAAPKKKPLALFAALGAVVVGMVITVVMIAGKGKHKDALPAAGPASANPETAPVVGAPPVTPTPPTPTPLAPVASPEPLPAPTAATTPTPEPTTDKPTTTTADKPATATTDKPTTATADKPATATADKPATGTTDTTRRRKHAGTTTATKPATTTTATKPATTTTKPTTTTSTTTTTATTKPATTTTTVTPPPPPPPDPSGTGSGSATTGRRRFGGGRI